MVSPIRKLADVRHTMIPCGKLLLFFVYYILWPVRFGPMSFLAKCQLDFLVIMGFVLRLGFFLVDSLSFKVFFNGQLGSNEL